MLEPPPSYLAYMLRVWRSGAGAPLRASLEDPRTGERHGFASLLDALAFLEARLQGATIAPGTSENEASF